MASSEKQKVLIVHNYYQIPGGEDIVVANEKKLLEDNGHEVVLYTRSNNEFKTMGVLRKLFMPFTTVFNPRTYLEVKRIIKTQKIEIVHVHNTLSLVSPSVYYAARKCKVPVIQTIHNFRFLCPGATFYRNGHICEDCVNSGLWCAIKYKCYKESRLLTVICVINTWFHRHTGILEQLNYIVLTEYNRKKLLQLKQIKPESVFIKPNFTGTNVVPVRERKKQIVYVGRLETIKGIKILLEAWKEYGKEMPKLVICGKGPLWEWCNNFIKENGVQTVLMVGYVEHETVIKILSQSEALVFPTLWYEGFPMTIIEAYSVGTPVIATNIGNAGDLVIDGITGLKFEDVESLISAVKRVLADSNMKVSAYEMYMSKYTFSLNYKIISDIYGKVTSAIRYKDNL